MSNQLIEVGRGGKSFGGNSESIDFGQRGYSLLCTLHNLYYPENGKYKYSIVSRYSTKALVNGPVHVQHRHL